MYALAASTGARRESLCDVEAEDVGDEYVHFRIVKGGTPYTVPLGPSSRAAVEGLLTCPKPVGGAKTELRSKLVGVSPSGLWW